jgi:hypothetical protein
MDSEFKFIFISSGNMLDLSSDTLGWIIAVLVAAVFVGVVAFLAFRMGK